MKPVILLPLSEIARKGKICDETLRRKVRAAEIEPDAWLQFGRRRSPLFVAPRAAALLALINTIPSNQAL